MTEYKMTNCPECQKPILNGGVFNSTAQFKMKCPWCKVTLSVMVKSKIVAEVIDIAKEVITTGSSTAVNGSPVGTGK
jgi:phage FluMu protein Com